MEKEWKGWSRVRDGGEQMEVEEGRDEVINGWKYDVLITGKVASVSVSLP